MAIDHVEVKVRAAVRVGGGTGFYLETPYVKSFNVKRARGQMTATFSTTLKVKQSQLDTLATNELGSLVEIWAGTITNEEAQLQEDALSTIFDPSGSRYLMSLDNDNFRKVFTGYVLSMSFNPCREDAEFLYLNMSGEDIFYFLKDKKFTRRAKPTNLEMWAAVTSVSRTRTNFDTKFPEKLEEEKLSVGDDAALKPTPTKTDKIDPKVEIPRNTAGGLWASPSQEDTTDG